MNDKMRIKFEKAIVTALINEMDTSGFMPVSVWDSCEYVKAGNVAEVIDAVFAVETSTIHFAPKGQPEKWGVYGVFIVGGNGEDCISDYHCGNAKFESAVKRVYDRLDNADIIIL